VVRRRGTYWTLNNCYTTSIVIVSTGYNKIDYSADTIDPFDCSYAAAIVCY
jgi:hypothetical protein